MTDKLPKISVIIPVYNSEAYLPKCLDSILLQTYGVYEIICVNDGSTDGSLDILNEYARKDPRIKIITQENQGQSTARNKGLDAASGDYISFIDSDDWVSLTLYKKFVQTIEDNVIDIFIFNAESYSEAPKEIFPRRFFDFSMWDKHQSIKTIHTFHDCNNPFCGNFSACNKIYRKEFLNRKNMRFIEDIIFEDQLFHVKTFLQSESIMLTDEPLYKYRSHENSTMNNLKDNVFDIFTIISKIDELVRSLGLYEEFKYALFQYKYEELTARFIETRFVHKPKFYQKMKNVLMLAKDDSLDFNICKQLKNFSNYQKILNSDCFEFYMNRSL